MLLLHCHVLRRPMWNCNCYCFSQWLYSLGESLHRIILGWTSFWICKVRLLGVMFIQGYWCYLFIFNDPFHSPGPHFTEILIVKCCTAPFWKGKHHKNFWYLSFQAEKNKATGLIALIHESIPGIMWFIVSWYVSFPKSTHYGWWQDDKICHIQLTMVQQQMTWCWLI